MPYSKVSAYLEVQQTARECLTTSFLVNASPTDSQKIPKWDAYLYPEWKVVRLFTNDGLSNKLNDINAYEENVCV